MPRRIAATLSLIVFSVALVAGAFQAGNSFSTVVLRAVVAMAWTFVIGLVLGWMAQRMLEENMSEAGKKIKNNQGNTPPT